MALPVTNRSHHQNNRRQYIPTPYSSLPVALLDTVGERGAWAGDSISLRTHQTVGGISDAIKFSGLMSALIQLPDDMWTADTGLSFTWTLAGCVVDPSCVGIANVDKLSLLLPDSNGSNDNNMDYTLPDCPSFSNDITKSGSISFGVSSTWKNPISISLRTPLNTLGIFCNITVAHLDFVVSSTGGGGGTTVDSSTAGGTTPVGTTLVTTITTTNSLGSTVVLTSTPAAITISQTATVTSQTAITTSGLTNITGGVMLTTKAPHFSTLSNGLITTIAPDANPTSQTLAAAENAKKAKTAGIIGGALGGLTLIILVIFLVWWRRKRASRSWNDGNLSSTEGLTGPDSSHPHSPRHFPPNSPVYHGAPPIYYSERSPSRPLSAQNTGNSQQGLGLGLTLVPNSAVNSNSEHGSREEPDTSDFEINNGLQSLHPGVFTVRNHSQIPTQLQLHDEKSPHRYE